MVSDVDERLKDALMTALGCADAAENTLIAAMIADCLAQLNAQVVEAGHD